MTELPATHASADRLVELGRAGVGGFVRDGDRLVRRLGEPLDAVLGTAVAWPRAVAWLISLADAAAACERLALFPGALDAAGIAIDGDALVVRADALVGALIGAPHEPPATPRWPPPEAAGRPADNTSNRYAIGLVAYHLLAREHPFAGRGLRLGLEDQARRGAPPFSADVAAALPPGLQSLCLRLLDPDPASRPASAAAIAAELRAIAAPAPIDATVRVPDEPVLDPVVAPPTPRRRRFGMAFVGLLPIAGAAIVAFVIVASPSAPSSRAGALVPPRAPLAAARELADCASCHPRQAAEWSRSVMAHSIESPLFGSLEMLIEEQVGRDRTCPEGAGILRAAGADPCVNPRTGLAVTGSGGAGWCVNCHAPGENLASAVPPWDGHAADGHTRRPLRDLLRPSAMEGISCVACHQMSSPTHPGASYEGNPSWTSIETGARFTQRPEDERGVFGIANSGYLLDPRALFAVGELVPGGAHRRSAPAATAYRRSSEFCGACHDVRLFGTDAITGVERGEHFKRLRNAYSEWGAWATDERRAGRTPASCQDCHMSTYPGTCEASPGAAAARGCPSGTAFVARPPGVYPTGHGAAGSPAGRVSAHYFSGVDVPLARVFDRRAIDDATLDVSGTPLGAHQRRDQLLASAFRFAIDGPVRAGDRLEIPVVVENVGAGHRVPAGFSQEREIWVHLRVTDARGALVYEVGRVDRGDEDLHDKTFLGVSTDDGLRDRAGRPQGLFGADVADGPDAPHWTSFGGLTEFRGRGLVNFQNGFMRCVTCIGRIDETGQCQPGPGQASRRADRYADGFYDPDTGACRSNLTGPAAFFETYFPIGALDATRGITKGPDAIIDTRSLAPHRPARYVYDLPAVGTGPYTVEATLEFRAFPPYLVRAFADYEARQDRRGLRPSGPLVDGSMLERLEIVHVARAGAVIR